VVQATPPPAGERATITREPWRREGNDEVGKYHLAIGVIAAGLGIAAVRPERLAR